MENKKRKNFYDPEYVSIRDNISIEEASMKIQNMKKRKATSLEGFVLRHGEELGKVKFEEFQNTSKHTKEKFMQKYGHSVGEKKWEEYLLKKDSTSYSWALKKANGDADLAKEIHEKRKNELSISFDLDYFIKKYGETIAKEKMKEFYHSKDSSSYEWALKKSCGDHKVAKKIYDERCVNKSILFGKASKESLGIFMIIYEWLMGMGLSQNDIFFGAENRHEICLYDSSARYRYYYDFCIEPLKLIIEYNGEKFHPNYEKYSIDYLNENFKHPYDKSTSVEDFIQKDKNKIQNALNHGYEIHVVWSSDDEKIENIKKIIKNKIKYENFKNK